MTVDLAKLIERLERLAKIARRALVTNKTLSVWSADPETLELAAEALSRLSGERDELRAERDAAEEKAVQWKYMSDRRADVLQQAIDQMNANLARAETAERQRDEAIERTAKDTGLLDFIEKHPSLEISCSWEDDDGPWEVHRVTGGRNDREWTKIGQGPTLREAIASAIRALKPGT